ncbi:MAG: hypothetical protein HQM11_04185 [SAR324 cluster bacterium]|nr:hypothetical protein [SAR324 cluster bacterium]
MIFFIQASINFRTIKKFLLTALILSIASVSQAQNKPPAAVSPVAVLGEVSQVQQQIIFNSFLTKLSTYFDLISQNQFLEAQEAAFESLQEQACTEEQCIRKIQEILQVENLFVLQILREGGDTQLTLTLVDLEKKTVESDYCENCGTRELNNRVDQLVALLISKAGVEVSNEKPVPPPSVAQATKPKQQPQPVVQPQAEPETPSASSGSRFWWHVTAISLAGMTGLTSQSTATQYNDLSKENGVLQRNYEAATTQENRDFYENKYKSNQSKMTGLKSTVQMLDLATLLFVGWEAYLLLSSPDDSTAQQMHRNPSWSTAIAWNGSDNFMFSLHKKF